MTARCSASVGDLHTATHSGSRATVKLYRVAIADLL
jgi:hypothetical protein